MLKVIIAVVLIIALTIGIVWLIDKFVPKKLKPIINIALWILIAFLSYKTFMSVYGEIQFNQLKDKRYKVVINKLMDIRDAELAHKKVTGTYPESFENLIRFIDTAQFTITQRRDTTVLDVEATERFGGVETFKTIIIIDTLGYTSVKDSLFKNDDRYKRLMNVPVGKEGAKFQLKGGFLSEDSIPVFEVSVDKSIILDGEDKNLIAKEKQTQSIDGVDGPKLKIGSMEEVNTNGNWPKNFNKKEQ
jgi:hypothetical protein